jgi:hypothetical protein
MPVTVINHRLYFPGFNPQNDIDPNTRKGGIALYNKCLGVFLRCFKIAEKIQLEGKWYYVNKKSYMNWKKRHPEVNVIAITRPRTRGAFTLEDAVTKLISQIDARTNYPLSKGCLLLKFADGRTAKNRFGEIKDQREFLLVLRGGFTGQGVVTNKGKLRVSYPLTCAVIVEDGKQNIHQTVCALNDPGTLDTSETYDASAQRIDQPEFLRLSLEGMGLGGVEGDKFLEEVGFSCLQITETKFPFLKKPPEDFPVKGLCIAACNTVDGKRFLKVVPFKNIASGKDLIEFVKPYTREVQEKAAGAKDIALQAGFIYQDKHGKFTYKWAALSFGRLSAERQHNDNFTSAPEFHRDNIVDILKGSNVEEAEIERLITEAEFVFTPNQQRIPKLPQF